MMGSIYTAFNYASSNKADGLEKISNLCLYPLRLFFGYRIYQVNENNHVDGVAKRVNRLTSILFIGGVGVVGAIAGMPVLGIVAFPVLFTLVGVICQRLSPSYETSYSSKTYKAFQERLSGNKEGKPEEKTEEKTERKTEGKQEIKERREEDRFSLENFADRLKNPLENDPEKLDYFLSIIVPKIGNDLEKLVQLYRHVDAFQNQVAHPAYWCACKLLFTYMKRPDFEFLVRELMKSKTQMEQRAIAQQLLSDIAKTPDAKELTTILLEASGLFDLILSDLILSDLNPLHRLGQDYYARQSSYINGYASLIVLELKKDNSGKDKQTRLKAVFDKLNSCATFRKPMEAYKIGKQLIERVGKTDDLEDLISVLEGSLFGSYSDTSSELSEFAEYRNSDRPTHFLCRGLIDGCIKKGTHTFTDLFNIIWKKSRVDLSSHRYIFGNPHAMRFFIPPSTINSFFTTLLKTMPSIAHVTSLLITLDQSSLKAEDKKFIFALIRTQLVGFENGKLTKQEIEGVCSVYDKGFGWIK